MIPRWRVWAVRPRFCRKALVGRLTSAVPDQGVISAFWHGRFLQASARRQLVGPRPWPVSSSFGGGLVSRWDERGDRRKEEEDHGKD